MNVLVFLLYPHVVLTQAMELHIDWLSRENRRNFVRHNGKARLRLLMLVLLRVLPHVP